MGSLGRTILILFVIIVAVSVLSEGLILYFNTQDEITAQIEAHLITAAESRAAHIKTFLEDQKSSIGSNALGVVFKDLLVLDKNNSLYAERLSKAKTRLKDTLVSSPQIHEAFITDSKGIIIASSDSTKEGLDRAQDPYFTEGKKGVFLKDLYYSTLSNDYEIDISAPILDSNKNILGVYVARISLNELVKIVQLRTGLGESGEMFLINSNSYMITPSKYIPDVVLKKQVNTVQSRACISDMDKYLAGDPTAITKAEDSTGVFLDYRGVLSLGTHAHISPEANWCLIAKIDEKEALGAFRTELQIITMEVALALLIIFSIISYFFSKRIIRPINILSNKISQITKGDLEVQLDKENTSEMQGLTDSINRILASMKLAMLRSNLSANDIGIGEAVKAKENAEKEINQEKDLLDSVINSISYPIFVKDEKHNWVLLNNSFCKFMGKKKEELLGKSDYEFFPKKEADVFWEKDEKVFNTGKENVNKENFTDSKGKVHNIVTKKTLHKESDGSKILIGVIHDVTKEK